VDLVDTGGAQVEHRRDLLATARVALPVLIGADIHLRRVFSYCTGWQSDVGFACKPRTDV